MSSKEARRALVKRSLAIRKAVRSNKSYAATLCCPKSPHERQKSQSLKRRNKSRPRVVKYRGWCEACHLRGKWCGYDHEKEEFVRGKQAERERLRRHRELRAALGGLSTKQKTLIRKLLHKFKAMKASVKRKEAEDVLSSR